MTPPVAAESPEKTVNTKPPGMFVLPDGKNVMVTFILVSSLFLLWGICNGMIDVMDKHFQNELGLTKAQSANVQFAHYLGYFLMALPAGWLARRWGWKGGIIAGLLMVAVGGFWFLPATSIQAAAHAGNISAKAAFVAYLVGVCAIAAGLTFLETVANPYTTVLGPARYAAARINLAQSCNGIGWIFGPIIGARYFYSNDPKIFVPYVAVAVVVLVLALIFKISYVPDIKNEDDFHLDDKTPTVSHSLITRPHFVLGVAAQFLYVAAQAGIFGFFINSMTVDKQTGFTMLPHIPDSWGTGILKSLFETGTDGALHISDAGASTLASAAFVFFLLGRISGAGLLKKFSAHKVLGLYAVLNVIICLLIFANLGWVSVLGVFGSYFFMSIMFPTIFALGIFGLGEKTKKASAFIVMAIMGGALLPKLMGAIADKYDMCHGFIVPAACFAFVAFYALTWPKWAKVDSLHGVGASGGH
jgi:FHS family L-fucose permease-like MFS transporter